MLVHLFIGTATAAAGAGCPMLSVRDPDGSMTDRQITLYALALLPIRLIPSVIGVAGWLYFYRAMASGIVFVGVGVRMVAVVYLSLLLGLLVLDWVPRG